MAVNYSNAKLYRAVFEKCRDPLFVLDRKFNIAAANPAAEALPGFSVGSREELEEYMGMNLEVLSVEGPHAPISLAGCTFEAKLEKAMAGQRVFYILSFSDVTADQELLREMSKIRQLNSELQAVFEHYAETIYIADGKGKTLRASENVAKKCGVKKDYLEGRFVQDLEKEGLFKPSVIARVIESKQREIVIQTTRIGKTLVSVGIPIKDDSGRISKIIAISRDITGQIEIGNTITEVKDIPAPAVDDKMPVFITCAPKMQQILDIARLVASVNSTVLITGESGTGKDLLARYIHQSSVRKNAPFVKINCGSISPNLVESELFGYAPGAFTGAAKSGKLGLFETANGGTVFLDEVGELPMDQQVKLLQVIQERKTQRVGASSPVDLDLRFIAATNKELEQQVEKGAFRQDLFYRLNVVPIYIPPLRERKEEIPLLIYSFLKKYNEAYHYNKHISSDALAKLVSYSWPGNVRELENNVERLVVIAKEDIIDLDDLPEILTQDYAESCQGGQEEEVIPLKEAVSRLEKELIMAAINKYGSGSRAAKHLKIDQSTLSRKMQKYSLEAIKEPLL